MLVAIPKVVLAEVTGAIASLLQYLRETGRCSLQAELVAGYSYGGHARTNRVLPRDEGSAAGRAGILRVVIREANAFHADAIDVRRGVAHRAHAVSTDVLPTDVITPDDQNVRFLLLSLNGCGRSD
jgi:hypothetical protein